MRSRCGYFSSSLYGIMTPVKPWMSLRRRRIDSRNTRQNGAVRLPYEMPKFTESGNGQLQSTQSYLPTTSSLHFACDSQAKCIVTTAVCVSLGVSVYLHAFYCFLFITELRLQFCVCFIVYRDFSACVELRIVSVLLNECYVMYLAAFPHYCTESNIT